MSFLNIRYPSGHLEVLPVQPNVPLFKALEAACTKRSLDASKHKLIYRKKPIDLSLPFRYSGLLNHANIELIAYTEDDILMTASSNQAASTYADNSVRVGLRLEDGYRTEWNGLSSTSLWNILEELSQKDERIFNLLSISTDGLAPCLVYINQKVCGEEYLRETKLSDLGVRTGAVLLQLIRHVAPLAPPSVAIKSIVDQPLNTMSPQLETKSHQQPSNSVLVSGSIREMESTSDEISLIFPGQGGSMNASQGSMNASQGTPIKSGNLEPFSVFANRPTRSMFGGNDDAQAKRQKPTTVGELLGISLEPDNTHIPQNDASSRPRTAFKFPTETAGQNLSQAGKCVSFSDEAVFCAPCDREMVLFRRNVLENIASEELSDDFFELTQAELRLIIAQLRKEGGSEAPFGVQNIQQAAQSRFFAKYLRCIIMFVWSDDYVLQACFQPQERVSALYDFIKSYLADPRGELQLYTTPPKVNLSNMDASLLKARLVPMSRIHMIMSGCSPKASTVLHPNLLGTITADSSDRAKTVAKHWMTQRPTIERH